MGEHHHAIEKKRVISIGEKKYQISRFTPNVGAHILGWFMVTLSENSRGTSSPEPEVEKAITKSGEEIVRALCYPVVFGSRDFEQKSFVLNECMKVCSRLEGDNHDLPMPIMAGERWGLPDVAEDLPLIMRLQTECLVFNLERFFDQGVQKELEYKATSKG